MNPLHKPANGRTGLSFILPVILENYFTIGVTLVYSSITGRISVTALTAMTTGNILMTLMTLGMTCVTTSSAAITARLYGEGDLPGASNVAEQAAGACCLITCALTLLCLIFKSPIISVLAPGADNELLRDLSGYYSVILLSLPCFVLFTQMNGILRACGDSSAALKSAIAMNALQLIFGWLFIVKLDTGMTGAALASLLSRAAGCAASCLLLFKGHRSLPVRFKSCFRIDLATWKRILRLGIPCGLESVCVQGGYLLANSIIVSLGSDVSAVYNVLNTVQTFPARVMDITVALAVTLVGIPLGAGDRRTAKAAGYRLLACSMAAELLIFAVVWFIRGTFCGFFTNDADVLASSLTHLPLILFYLVLGLSINVADPCLRTGGDARFVLINSAVAVWAVRIPLTLLFCTKMGMGIKGALYANYISLALRAVAGQIRYARGKWLTKSV